jgi:ABC-2 type transport system ATP-binding protein
MVSHLGIIYKGKMLFQGSLPELHQFQKKGSRVLVNTSNNHAAKDLLQEYNPELVDDLLTFPFRDNDQVAAINRTLTQNNLDVYLLHPKENNLEQLFIDLTTAHS